VWNDISPRVGLTYDISGSGRTVAKSSFATYFGQMAPGQLANNLISIAQVSVRYPWNDANNDTVVQASEVDFSGTPLFRSATFNPADPTNFRSQGTLDPNVKNDRTREFIVGLQHELMRNFGFEVNYVWRNYDQFQWQDRGDWDTSYFQAFTFTPPANCTARCEPVTYYRPTATQPGPFVYTNIPDRYRNYNGIEFAAVKRYSKGWMANVSFAYNDAKDYWDSARAYEDPTNIDLTHGAEFAPESGGSGIDNVFTNAKWLFKASGLYTLPWGQINIGGNAQYRQGYPFPQAIVVTNRGGGVDPAAGTFYLLDKMGEKRHPNLFIADLKVERSFRIGTAQIIPSVDVFNVGNANTVLARRRGQYTFNATTGVGSTPSNANQISGIVAPRVVRFGVRMTW